MHTDFLIAGQGLAGSLLAYNLMQQGASVMVADRGGNSSSLVSAGMFNPITGQRTSPVPKAAEIFPLINSVFTDLENILGVKLLHRKNIMRGFASAEEKAEMSPKLIKNGGGFLAGIHDAVRLEGYYPFESGAFELTQSGNVNTTVFLKSFRKYLADQFSFMEAELDYADIKILDNGVQWKDISATKLIFCEGYKCLQNPWFQMVPLRPFKGQLITAAIEGLSSEYIVNHHAAYILPHAEENMFTVGATYERGIDNEIPTPEGLNELESKLRLLVKLPFKLMSHEAGVRPTMPDRKPVMGLHPQHHSIGIFNGLGTKGVMQAPLYARMLALHLLQGNPVDKDVSLNRFIK